MTNYEGMDAKTFNDLFLEKLNASPDPKAEVKNEKLISKMREFGFRRAVVQDEHPNEPVCRICLTFGHNKGIEGEYCPECRADRSRIFKNFSTKDVSEGVKGGKPSHFRELLDVDSCAKCSHSGSNKEEGQLWCFLHSFPIPRPFKSKVKSFYKFVCDDADNKKPL